jgi:hypothetical protein
VHVAQLWRSSTNRAISGGQSGAVPDNLRHPEAQTNSARLAQRNRTDVYHHFVARWQPLVCGLIENEAVNLVLAKP